MTILEKIQQAQSQKDLDLLTQEIIFSVNYKENIEEFKVKSKELNKTSPHEQKGQF